MVVARYDRLDRPNLMMRFLSRFLGRAHFSIEIERLCGRDLIFHAGQQLSCKARIRVILTSNLSIDGTITFSREGINTCRLDRPVRHDDSPKHARAELL